MFSNIVHLALALAPGLPDELSKITASVKSFVKDLEAKDGAAALRESAKFSRILADEADKAADALDPAGAAVH